ncbi:nucleoside-diphosphate-sugar epimerase [Apiospora rasikravindrae]|uniref:Nucleoside-diphosphate-sugar epimerase n=1 Tax=Apiospora rasikravindrae TaxID=990691 RepID=A0ABR1SYQ4_9PEZI
MRLIITGATGFVGSEVLRQALRMPEITSIVAVARKPVQLEGPEATSSKLKSVIVQDYDQYPDDVKKEFAGAGACIWTVAVTPTKSKSMEFAEVKRICQDFTMAGMQAMYEAGPARPFRFMYMSGTAAPRDANQKPGWFMPEYSQMRGQGEVKVLDFAKAHPGEIEACVAKPGLITSGGWKDTLLSTGLKVTGLAGSVKISQVAAAMLRQVVNGFEKEPLQNDDLVRLGS